MSTELHYEKGKTIIDHRYMPIQYIKKKKKKTTSPLNNSYYYPILVAALAVWSTVKLLHTHQTTSNTPLQFAQKCRGLRLFPLCQLQEDSQNLIREDRIRLGLKLRRA